MSDTNILSGKRILVVDDQFVNRIIVKEMLKKYEVDITEAGDGDAAVETVMNEDPFDIILMDVMMPSVDGFEATRQIRALEDNARSSVPVIAMTSDVTDEDLSAAAAAGMNDHVTKPVDGDVLVEKIVYYLAGSKG